MWLATLLGAVPPFLGPLIYMLFRPPEYLDDVRERELELKMIERGLDGRDLTCWVCSAQVEPEFLVCPVCTTRLRQACANCSRPLEPAWQVCPYCETPVVADENTVPLRPPTPGAAGRRARPAPVDAAGRSLGRALTGHALATPARVKLERSAPRSQAPGKLRGRMAVERTLILAKPDAVERSLAGEILARFERRGLTLRAARLLVASRELGESTTPSTTRSRSSASSSTSSPRARRSRSCSRARARSRRRARRSARRTPPTPIPGSLRGDFALAMPNNLVHGSDSPESAEREIALWFPDGLV